MPNQFKIRGGKPLAGEIEARGSKNASLPLIAASILTDQKCVLRNVPKIRDVENLLEILRGLGSRIGWYKDRLEITNDKLESRQLHPEIVRKLRGSVLLTGALLGRFGKVVMPLPGGDQIGARPLDAHFAVFEGLGSTITQTVDHFLHIALDQPLPGVAKIVLPEPSVTATENAMLACTLFEGEAVIKGAAAEPHVQDLARFLRAMGASIEGEGTHIIYIRGSAGKLLRGAQHQVIPDTDEAMSLAVLAAATRSAITIKNFLTDHAELGLMKLREMGVNFETSADSLYIKKPVHLYRSAKIQSGPYPKLMSDQLPPFAVLATQASGTSLIHEWMYEGRLGYINELIKMGANAVIMDPHRALIVGPTPLRGTELQSLDIRSGMTSIIAGLVAEGETLINNAQIIDRGYEKIEERLGALGADIKRL